MDDTHAGHSFCTRRSREFVAFAWLTLTLAVGQMVACAESHQVSSDGGLDVAVTDVIIVRDVSGATVEQARAEWVEGRTAVFRALCDCYPSDFVEEGYIESEDECGTLVASDRENPECGVGAPNVDTLVRTIETASLSSHRYAACVAELGCEGIQCLALFLWADGVVVLPELGMTLEDPGVAAYSACFPGSF